MKEKILPTVIVILRGYEYSQIATIAEVISKSQRDYAVEVTLNTETAFEDISKLNKDFPELQIGAGTVLSLEQAKNAIASGAQFLLSPIMFDKEIYKYCQQNNILTIPGAFSPSEIQASFNKGADIVKVFPASVVGKRYFKDIQTPLDKLPLMAVGGINSENAQEYLENGATYLGIGSGIFNKKDILNRNVRKLEASLKQFEKKLNF